MPTEPRRTRALPILLVSCLLFPLGADRSVAWGHTTGNSPTRSVDWPAFLGPQGDGHSPNAGLLPAAGAVVLSEAWRIPLGSGYSSIVSAEGRAFLLFSDGSHDVAAALSTTSGKELWRTELAATHRGHDGSSDGPIATPAVAEGRLVAATPTGLVTVLDVTSGARLWSVDLRAAYGVEPTYYGYSSSPLVDDGRVILQGGGSESAALLAFSLDSGELLWTSGVADGESYASPAAIQIDGQRQVVALGHQRLLAVDPATGDPLWTHELADAGADRWVAVPGDRLLVTGWDAGGRMLRVKHSAEGFTVEELWEEKRIGNSHGTSLFAEGAIYAFNGSILLCLDGDSGEMLWRHRTYDGSLIGVDGHLVLLGRRSGRVHVLRPNREHFDEVASWQAFEPGSSSISPAAVAGGLLLIRDLEEVVAVRGTGSAVRPPAPSALSERPPAATELWRRSLETRLTPSGRAGLAVAPGRAYTAISNGADDYAVAFDTENGAELWRQELGPTHQGAARGPESSPVFADGRLFVLATSCSLHALSAADGHSIWQLDLGRQLGAGERSRGCQSSPAVLGDTLFVSNAGDEHRAIALEAATGRLRWSNSEIDPPRYSSPVVARLDGEPQVLVQGWARGEESGHRSTLYGLDPTTGRTLWSYGTVGDWSYQPATPVSEDTVLYHTWNHARLLRLGQQGDGTWAAAEVWQTEGFDSVVVRNDLLFGAGLRDLLCLRVDDGTVLWREPLGQTRLSRFGEAIAVVAVEAPTVRLVAISGDRYRELAAQGVFSAGAVNATPASAAGSTLLVRNEEVLVALRWPGSPER